ncbi:hypothetical protein [Alteromonas gracilis]|uniref:hypothetical protein n=1 Tax=Alteromonas gracilis TaxID=1479524 RepID=UPI003736C255
MESKADKKYPVFYTLLGVVVAVAGISVIAVMLVYGLTFPDFINDQEKFAQFGDFFGGVLNPILSFLTIVLLVGSLALQRVELSKVVEELELTRKVHVSSVNMNHWEHILKNFEEGDSEILLSSTTFKEILDTKIGLVEFYRLGTTRPKQYSVYEIFCNEELFSKAISDGYWTERADIEKAFKPHNRALSDFTSRLDANLKFMAVEVKQLMDLGCPKLRAKEIIQIGNDLIHDYFGNKSPQVFKANIIPLLPSYEIFIKAFENYPENISSV